MAKFAFFTTVSAVSAVGVALPQSDPGYVGPNVGRPSPVTDTCTVPSPVTDIFGVNFYSSDNKSVVIKKSLEEDRDATQSIRVFYTKVLAVANKIQEKRVESDDILYSCLTDMLVKWAEADAMLGRANSQGVYHRTWATLAIAIGVLPLLKSPFAQTEQFKTITRWLRSLAQENVIYFNRRKSVDNLLAWASASSIAVGYVAKDERYYDWGVRKFLEVIDGATPDGGLPVELLRGAASSRYHCFAMTALMIGFSYRRHFDDPLTDEEKSKLSKIARYTLTHSGPNEAKLVENGCSAWIALYNNIQADDEVMYISDVNRLARDDVKYRFIGNVSYFSMEMQKNIIEEK